MLQQRIDLRRHLAHCIVSDAGQSGFQVREDAPAVRVPAKPH
jgi:hypothetical protein